MKNTNLKKYLPKNSIPILVILLLCFALPSNAQKVDTVINMGIYKSYFSYGVKQPLYVTYNLYKGGGTCDRKEEHFSFKKCGLTTATDAEYKILDKFDKGHLANAEDFANDCEKEEKTFCYYNCVPQTVKLNRGIWKKWEENILLQSQTQRLFVIAGAIYDKKIITTGIAVPIYCYKIVVDTKTKKVMYCLIFPNDESNTVKKISLVKLKKKLGYDLMP